LECGAEAVEHADHRGLGLRVRLHRHGILEDFAAAYSSEAGQTAGAELLEDEQRFIDLSRSPLWFGEENVVIG
jgi:hypothetical protein